MNNKKFNNFVYIHHNTSNRVIYRISLYKKTYRLRTLRVGSRKRGEVLGRYSHSSGAWRPWQTSDDLALGVRLQSRIVSSVQLPEGRGRSRPHRVPGGKGPHGHGG